MLHRKLTNVATLVAIVVLVAIPVLVLTACSGTSNSAAQQSGTEQLAQPLGVHIVGTCRTTRKASPRG